MRSNGAPPRASLPPAARHSCRSAGPPEVGRRPASEPALPRARDRAAAPGDEDQLKELAGRVFAQQLDRDKPLWEIWLVDGVEGDRFAPPRPITPWSTASPASTSSRCSSTPRPTPWPRPTWATAGCRGRCRLRAAARRGACRARHDPGGGRTLRARGLPRPAEILSGARDAAVGLGSDGPGGPQIPPRRAPTTSRSGRTGASPGCVPT